jgi:uncharacterized membrane protein YfcA
MEVLPWMMLGATLLFVFGPRLAAGRPSKVGADATAGAIVVASVFELAVAVYGGSFGGAVGIVNLAILAAIGMTDIHAMNALKAVLGGVINGVAVLAFVAVHVVYWLKGAVMIAGALVGGYCGAHYAQKLPPPLVRGFVILVGTSMTIYFFVRVAG